LEHTHAAQSYPEVRPAISRGTAIADSRAFAATAAPVWWSRVLSAGYLGRATDELAGHFGGAIGGLLNATFGNITELIIGALALRAGFTDLVKASLSRCSPCTPFSSLASTFFHEADTSRA
jgi:hypothetical protein